MVCIILFLLLVSCRASAQDEDGYDEEESAYFLQKEPGHEPVMQKRDIPDEEVQKLKRQDAFWYAEGVINTEKKEAKTAYIPIGQRTWFQTLLWLLIIGGFAATLVWFLAENKVSMFSRRNRAFEQGSEEAEQEDIFAINYQQELDKALQQGNYRLAVRLHFLRLLKDMSDHNIIRYKQDKTNLDYMLELHGAPYYDLFFRITRNYEFCWYGQFDVDRHGYDVIYSDFNQINRQLFRA